MITLSQGDCALAGISHSFPENPYLRAQVKGLPWAIDLVLWVHILLVVISGPQRV